MRHSAYGALIRGYGIIVPRDAVCGFEGVDEEAALDYLHDVYHARIVAVDELSASPSRGDAAPPEQRWRRTPWPSGVR